MMKRLALSATKRQGSEWPPGEDGSDGSLFSGRRPLRKIVVMIDAELLAPPPSHTPIDTVDPRSLLSGLLDHPLVQLFRFADQGPPASVKPDQIGTGWAADRAVYLGWAVLQDQDASHGIWSVTYPTEKGFSVAGVVANAPAVAAEDTSTDSYQDLEPEPAAMQRHADALAAQVAGQALHADVYVTERPYLRSARWGLAQGVTLCRPEEALPLLSLFFRTQGVFLIAPKMSFNRGLFFWVGARELLPEAWRWFSACVQHATASDDDDLLLLAGSLLQRVDRALETRDAVHVALNQVQNNDLRDDALANLDTVLVLLMGAIDVAARVAHRTLGLPAASEYAAAWQKNKKGGWLDQVRAARPTLAALVDLGTRGEHIITILRLLRNSVHGAALQGIAVQATGAKPQESLVGLPPKDATQLLASMNALEGEASWGVKPLLPGRTHVDPGILVERLFLEVPALLNGLMAETPVELLSHVKLTAADRQAPAPSAPGSFPDPFTPWIRQSIRLQLGL